MKISTQTVTVTEYVLTLTEAELAAALVDPESLQQALRDARGETKRGRHGAKNLTLTAAKPVKKERQSGPKKAPGRQGAASHACPDCGKGCSSARALAIHRGRQHKAGASAAPSSENR